MPKFLSIFFLFILSCSDEADGSDSQNIEFGFDKYLFIIPPKGSLLRFNCKGAQSMDLIELYINNQKSELGQILLQIILSH